MQIKEAYAEYRRGEMWLESMHIAPYQFARDGGHPPERPRKLLLHRRELKKLQRLVGEKGVTLIPVRAYFNKRGIAKIKLGICKGKRQRDKRQAIAERDAKREAEREMGRYRKGG